MFSVFSTSNSKAAEALKIGPAEISFNAGYMSNYVWRGLDQNSGDGSASFGVDASLPYGIYLGSWTASVAGTTGANQELDFYGGITKSFGIATADIGYIAYAYPGSTDNSATNFGEFYGKLNLSPENIPLSFDIAYYELDTKTDANGGSEYIEYGVSYAAPSDTTLAISYGDYEKSNTVTTVSVGKSFAGIDFTLAYIDTNHDAAGTPDKDFLTLTVGKSF
jgi:uncharacterized protein (TIGR02001 family)